MARDGWAELRWNAYGKSAVRLVKVTRAGDRHSMRDLGVSVAFEGEFEQVYTEGDNSPVLPTDTMKNTVYAMASQHPVDPIEEFALTLGRHFLARNAPVSVVRIDIEEHGWRRVKVGEVHHPHSFIAASEERRIAHLRLERAGPPAVLEAGIEDLVLLKTTGSAFEGYVRDEYTTLPETSDRILATAVSARWRYDAASAGGGGDYNAWWWAARQALIEAFAERHSLSVQHTLHEMGARMLAACEAIEEVRLTLPNKHHLLVNLAPFGIGNPNEIFVPTTEPYGLIQGTVRRPPR